MILHDRKIYIEVWTLKQHKNATTTKWTLENTHFWASKIKKFLIRSIWVAKGQSMAESDPDYGSLKDDYV